VDWIIIQFKHSVKSIGLLGGLESSNEGMLLTCRPQENVALQFIYGRARPLSQSFSAECSSSCRQADVTPAASAAAAGGAVSNIGELYAATNVDLPSNMPDCVMYVAGPATD